MFAQHGSKKKKSYKNFCTAKKNHRPFVMFVSLKLFTFLWLEMLTEKFLMLTGFNLIKNRGIEIIMAIKTLLFG